MAEEAVVKPQDNLDIFSTRPISQLQEQIEVKDKEGLSAEENEEQKKQAEIEQQKAEDAKKALETKPTPKPIEFVNPESEKVFNYLKEGKIDDALAIYNERKKLSSVDTMTPEEKIKLDLKYQNPDLDDNDINGLFEEAYERPEKPELIDDPTEEDEAKYKKDLASWEKKNKAIDNKIARASKQAAKNLSAKVSELILPDIQKDNTPSLEAIEKAKKQREEFLQQVEKGLSEFNGFSTVYKDKEVEIPIVYSIDEDEKKQLQPAMKDFDGIDYIENRWLKGDGSWDGLKINQDRYKLENFDKIMQAVANEAGSRRLKAHLESKRRPNFTGSRDAVPASVPNAQQQVKSWQEQAFGSFQ